MLDEVTYICIRIHGSVIPNTEEKEKTIKNNITNFKSFIEHA